MSISDIASSYRRCSSVRKQLKQLTDNEFSNTKLVQDYCLTGGGGGRGYLCEGGGGGVWQVLTVEDWYNNQISNLLQKVASNEDWDKYENMQAYLQAIINLDMYIKKGEGSKKSKWTPKFEPTTIIKLQDI